jgi:hypothetical protein
MVKSRRMEQIWNVAQIEKRNACRLLVGKTEETRPLGRPRNIWMDNNM